MNKVVFCIILIFTTFVTYSCTFPYSGPAYDNLIEVSKLSESGQFYLELPKEYCGSKKTEVFIYRYTKDNYENLILLENLFDSGNSLSSDEYDKKVAASQPEKITELGSFKSNNDKEFIKFSIDLNEGYIHKINVHWHCLCSTYGSSEPLENINLIIEK